MAFNWGGAGSGAISGATAGSTFGPWGAAAGGVAGGLMGGLMDDGSESYEKAQEQLEKYYQESQGYLKPYNQFGQDAHADLSGAMKRLLDPQALQNDWLKGYTESESAKNTAAMAKENGLDAASSLGLMGSNTALNAIQGGTTNIGLADRQNYMDSLLQKYLAGAGIAGNIYNTGATSANNMANNAMMMGGNSAQMAFGGQAAPGDMMAKMMGTGTGMVSGLKDKTGGGWSFGGK